MMGGGCRKGRERNEGLRRSRLRRRGLKRGRRWRLSSSKNSQKME